MIKNIYCISDVELGKRDLFDDFKDEDTLIEFITEIGSKTSEENLLILNGDTFDFLKMPYQKQFTHHITEDISLWKLNKIIQNYPKVFQSLQNFLQSPHNYLHFNIGNHDLDLIWPKVQELLKKTLGHPEKITIDYYFDNQEVHIEHGNQVDYFYKFDTENPFLKYRGKKLLNLPLGYVAVTKYFIELKKEFPAEEKLYPRHQVFEAFPEFRKLKQKISRNFIFKGLIFNFIFNFFDPITSVPYINLIKHVFAHGLEVIDETKFLKKRFKNLRSLYPNRQVYIMGHLHLTHYELTAAKDHIQIVTDTWREEIKISSNGQSVLKPKTYSHIIYQDNKLKQIDLLTFNY